MLRLILIPLVLLYCGATAQQDVLRYKKASCNSLEPVYVTENWQYPGGDVSQTVKDDDGPFKQPRRSRDRSPPYKLTVSFNQYRRGREYSVNLESFDYFDSFMLQARAKAKADGNATLVGSFQTIPTITKHIHCLGKRKSSVADKGRPIRLSNMTFSWRAPPTDYGPIRFVASVVAGEEYHLINTEEISFNAFPVSIRGCGREMSCFRQCTTSPTCPPDESSYMAVMYLARGEVVISMGGIVDNDQKYIALGFGEDKMTYQNMDVAVCYRDGDKIMLGHYLIENKLSHPYLHRSKFTLDGSDIDTTTNFIWCQFRRPIKPDSIWDLDLSQPMYHFYFMGQRNQSMIYLPRQSDMWDSGMRRNFTEILNDIAFSGGVGGVHSPGSCLRSFLSYLLAIFALFSILCPII